MSEQITRPLCVQIAALGGQGGGVLTDWLAETARMEGYPAQATSIPGVAQRTGATTYYFELLPVQGFAGEPIFSLFPDEDSLDLMCALEPTEAGRALEAGLITARTTVISATRRIYSTAEKIIAGDGTVPADDILDAIERGAGTLNRMDMDILQRASGGMGNAILFGAIIGTGILPLSADAAKQAIIAKGVGVDPSLAGFDAGMKAVQSTTAPAPASDQTYDAPPPNLSPLVQTFPDAAQAIIGHGCARLLDYQDEKLVMSYLAHLKDIAELNDDALLQDVARRLAAWMSYEDIIRVAQLKTRPGRLDRIRREVNVGDDDPLHVTDYLKPGRREMADVLPTPLARLLMAFPGGKKSPGVGLKMTTTGPVGFGLFKVLSGLKPLRRMTHRHSIEAHAINTWIAAIHAAAAHHMDLAKDVVELAAMARGYGDIRERGLEKLDHLLGGFGQRMHENADALSAEIKNTLEAMRTDPDNLCR